MKILIVVGAEQITECESLPTLSLPSMEHVWLIGDHIQIKSQVSPLSSSRRINVDISCYYFLKIYLAFVAAF